MPKNKTTLSDDIAKHKDRLQQISGMNFGALSDDEALQLLAERKHLQDLYDEYQKRQNHITELEAEEEQKEVEIQELNQSISPDKDDSTLLSLITHRKELEDRLMSVHAEIENLKKGKLQMEKKPEALVVSEEKKEVGVSEEGAAWVSKEASSLPPAVEVPAQAPQATEEAREPVAEIETSQEEPAPVQPERTAQQRETDEFGREGILFGSVDKNLDLQRYLDQLKTNLDSLGTLLQGMPANAKKNKDFMLEVAKIDPAYAMHYADNALKQDEDFNVKVAEMKNKRNSGNALAEMLPESRTAKVVLAGVKQDYKNIRFALPPMEGYAEMLSIAKKATLDAVAGLKDAVDVNLLVPKPLQKDKAFMQEVEKIVGAAKTS